MLVRDPAKRFRPQALLCTDFAREPAQVVSWFVRRWSVEVTFQEVRAHLGVETQRQWSDTAIARTTPCLHALPARPVLYRHSAGCTAPGTSAAGGRHGRMVPQATPHLRRCPGRGPLRDLARAGFSDITTPTPSDKTPLPPASPLGLRPLPRRMNGQSRA